MGRLLIAVGLLSSYPRGFLHGGCGRDGAVVCPGVAALAVRLWAGYSTLGPLGLLGAENAPAFQVLLLALRRQVLVRHGTRSLIELFPVKENGPSSTR